MLALTLYACSQHPLQDPPPPSLNFRPPEAWDAYNPAQTEQQKSIGQAPLGTHSPLQGWLFTHEDPQLKEILQNSLTNNIDLQTSALRLDSAYARTFSTGAAQRLKINHQLDGSRNRQSIPLGEDRETLYTTALGFGFEIAWEIDLWRKLKNLQQASVLDYQSSQQLHEFAKLSLLANTAKAWYHLAEANLLQQLSQQRLNNLADNLDIIKEGYQAGLNGPLDIYLARADLQQEKARLAHQAIQIKAATRNLQLLMGQYPKDDLTTSQRLPLLTQSIPTGLPSQLLTRRPDLLAAQYQLRANERNAKVAHLQRFPAFRLTAQLGTRSEEFKDLLSGDFLISTLFASLVTPLLDGGKLKAEEQIAYNLVSTAELHYRNTALLAFNEVESALTKAHYLQQQHAATQRSAAQFQQAEQLAFEQYQAGLVNYVTVLESQRRAFDASKSEIQLRNQLIQNRIDLHLALGGDFGPTH